MTFGNYFEDSDDLRWFGLFPTPRALIASLVAFKNPNTTAGLFVGAQRASYSSEMK